MRHLKRIVAPIAVLAVVLSAIAGIWLHARATHAAAALSSSCAPWALVSGVNPGTFNNQLFGVAAISASDVWAVGDEGPSAGGPNSTLIEHWNGAAWILVASPNVSSAYSDGLASVAAIVPTDVWAVGSYYDTTLTESLTLTEHWNGTAWSIVPSPNVSSFGGTLSGVSADATNDVWAVGSYYDSTLSSEQALIEHWNGTIWSVVPSGSAGIDGAVLNSVKVISATDVWAVGDYFNGTGSATFTEHWDGTNWSIVSSPDGSPADNYLTSVTASGPNNVWAVGYMDFATSAQIAMLTEHWDGTSWKQIPGYTDGANAPGLQAASIVPGSSLVLAVGQEYVGSNDVSLAVRWNGTVWTRMQTSNQNSPTNVLYGVAAVSATNAWAVGEYVPTLSSGPYASMRLRRTGPYAGIPQERALILHYQAPAMGKLCP